MKNISNAVVALRQEIVRLASAPTFKHHRWYVKYHLCVVEKISNELCDIYTQADRHLVTTLVWLHDCSKITGSAPQIAASTCRNLLSRFGFDDSFIELAIRYVALIDQRSGIQDMPMEVQIVSSADGASHFTGPFYLFYWLENPHRPYEELLSENIAKMRVDYGSKITLPEVRNAFAARYGFVAEMLGDLPEKYLAHSNTRSFTKTAGSTNRK